MGLEKEAEVLFLTAKRVIDRGDDMTPIVSIIKNDLPTAVLFSPTFGEEEKDQTFTEMFMIASFFEPEAILFASDSFVGTPMGKDEIIDDAQFVRPSEDVNAREAVMIVGRSKTDDELMAVFPYRRDDLGKIEWLEPEMHVIGDKDDSDDKHFDGFVSNLMEAALKNKAPIPKEAHEGFIAGMMERGMQLYRPGFDG